MVKVGMAKTVAAAKSTNARACFFISVSPADFLLANPDNLDLPHRGADLQRGTAAVELHVPDQLAQADPIAVVPQDHPWEIRANRLTRRGLLDGCLNGDRQIGG